LQPIEEEKGLAALPAPSRGDIFLDFEAVPYVFDTGLEYLIGTVSIPEEADVEPNYECRWSFGPRTEKEAFERFIDFVMDRWKRYPDLHIYHYAPYEQTAIKRLAGRHGTCVDAVDRLLRAGIFVDLYRIVRQALRASVESYSSRNSNLSMVLSGRCPLGIPLRPFKLSKPC
jgi:predicted RecB family nuclease